MADTKGTDPKPSDTKSGAVKPPVLDLKARDAGSGKSGPEAGSKAAGGSTAKPAPQVEKPGQAAAARTGGFAFGAALAGGALGLAAAYGLAFFGLWPTPALPPPPADPRLAQLAAAVPELETVTQTTQSELATFNQRLAALEAAEPAAASAAPAPDIAGLEADIAALDDRLETLASGPAAAADAEALEALRADVSGLGTRLDELNARLGTAEAALRTLDSTVTETSAAVADQPTDIGAVLQLPLVLSGLEAAFASGRPYEAELAALRAAFPESQIPPAIANAAPTGLPRPDAIARRFDAVLPDMLAGRPPDPEASWQEGAVDWFGAIIALRPTGEIEGDAPEAVMSRLEGAVARRDFVTAEALLAELPEPMRNAAGDVAGLIASQAEAARFIEALRAQALGGGSAS